MHETSGSDTLGQSPLFRTCDAGITRQRPEEHPAGIRCDAGYGTATHVTAVFGMIAAGRVLEKLAE